jgi:hypothetical protein
MRPIFGLWCCGGVLGSLEFSRSVDRRKVGVPSFSAFITFSLVRSISKVMEMFPFRIRRAGGFTLVELLVVIRDHRRDGRVAVARRAVGA